MGDVIPFRRPAKPERRTYAQLQCMFCHTEHAAVISVNQRYHDCPGCDEQAAVPVGELDK